MITVFDRIAEDYDLSFTHSHIGHAQRLAVWNYLDKHERFNHSRVLEINCGTGEDAIFLASKNNKVVATDVSEAMIARAQKKVVQKNLEGCIQTSVCDLTDLSPISGSFDLIFSNFGGFNCVNPYQLGATVLDLADRLEPGGRVVCVLMGRFCLWETAYFLMKGQPSAAGRRSRPVPVEVEFPDGSLQPTWYYSPRGLTTLFKPKFRPVAVRPVGFFLPPSYLEPFFIKRPNVLKALASLEKQIRGNSLVAYASDHYLAEFRLV